MMLTAPASERMPVLNCCASTSTDFATGLESIVRIVMVRARFEPCPFAVSRYGIERLSRAGARLSRRRRPRRAGLQAARPGLGAGLPRRGRCDRALGTAPGVGPADRAADRRV